jgi:acetylxylan esterase
MVRAAYPGYAGWRPKMQLFHGTADETLNYTNLAEEVKQWTGILGLAQKPTTVEGNTPLVGWTKRVYGEWDWVEAYSAWNVTHNIPVQEEVVMDFFDLTCTDGGCLSWGQGGPVASQTGGH